MIVVIFVVSAIPVVILMIPVAFVQPPAFTIVIIVRMKPIRPFVGRALPVPFHPSVVMPIRGPVPLDPDEARARNRPAPLVTHRWWWRSDVHPDLCRSRDGESDCEQYSADPIQFHLVSPVCLVLCCGIPLASCLNSRQNPEPREPIKTRAFTGCGKNSDSSTNANGTTFTGPGNTLNSCRDGACPVSDCRQTLRRTGLERARLYRLRKMSDFLHEREGHAFSAVPLRGNTKTRAQRVRENSFSGDSGGSEAQEKPAPPGRPSLAPRFNVCMRTRISTPRWNKAPQSKSRRGEPA
jgi:hypothetical protein